VPRESERKFPVMLQAALIEVGRSVARTVVMFHAIDEGKIQPRHAGRRKIVKSPLFGIRR